MTRTCKAHVGLLVTATLQAITVRSMGASISPHPGPGELVAAAARLSINKQCAQCHSEIAREWSQSWHHSAYTDSEFQKGLEREPKRVHSICIGCHAPESAPGSQTAQAALLAGITCVTCHLPENSEGLHKPGAGNIKPSDIHSKVNLISANDVTGCSNCHEFKFITERPNYATEAAQWMQRTVREFNSTRSDNETCTSCHMPLTQGKKTHHSHRFIGGHNEEMVRRSLDVRVTRPQNNLVRVELIPNTVAHAVPTGDLFRRISVTVQPDGYSPLAGPNVRYLTRHHVRIGGGLRLEVYDDRPILASTTVELPVTSDFYSGAVKYRVAFERVSYLHGDDERNAAVEATIELAQGLLQQ